LGSMMVTRSEGATREGFQLFVGKHDGHQERGSYKGRFI